MKQSFYQRSRSTSTSTDCVSSPPSSPSSPSSPTMWLRRALSKPRLRNSKKSETLPLPVSLPHALARKANSLDSELVPEDPFAKDPLIEGLHTMNTQGMESGEVLPRGEMSCWSASSESLVMQRRLGWSSLKQLFKRSW